MYFDVLVQGIQYFSVLIVVVYSGAIIVQRLSWIVVKPIYSAKPLS
jgi:hypothetical protein